MKDISIRALAVYLTFLFTILNASRLIVLNGFDTPLTDAKLNENNNLDTESLIPEQNKNETEKEENILN